ncbi:MAG: AraC family transcriptional regulator [Planctomycetota bacterium]
MPTVDPMAAPAASVFLDVPPGQAAPPRAPLHDPLGEALQTLSMDGVFYARSHLTAPWGIDLPPMTDTLMFHVVTRGVCYIQDGPDQHHTLPAGTFTLLPRAQRHVLVSAPGAPVEDLFDLPRQEIGDRYEVLVHGRGGDRCDLVCGAVSMQHPAARRLVDLLPDRIVVESWSAAQTDWFQSILRLIAHETESLAPGSEAVVTRLADVLVIQAIRSWIERDPAASTGWLGALRDPQVGRALAAVHRHPERSWTVENLAEHAAMSRSAFAARFVELVGQTPIDYARQWKMRIAEDRLRNGEPVSELAYALGYASEAAFRRAFKRVTGTAPGAARRQGAA